MRDSDNQVILEKVKRAFLSNPRAQYVLKSYLSSIIQYRILLSDRATRARQFLNPYSSWKDNFILREVKKADPPLVDVGCGWGWLTYEASSLGLFTIGMDIDAGLIRHTKTVLSLMGVRPPLIIASATHLPLRDSVVGMLTYIDVIEHIRDTSSVFSQARRVLKAGGKALITTPNAYSIERFIAKVVSTFLRIKASGPHLHKKFFTPLGVCQFAETQDFRITTSLGIGLFMVSIMFLANLLGLTALSTYLQILDLKIAKRLPAFTSCCLVSFKKSRMNQVI